MAIDLVTQVPELNVDVLQRALSDIKNQAVGTSYASTATEALGKAEAGKMVVMDDGTNQRVYFKTSDGTTGFFPLKQNDDMIIPNRTDDPTTPVTGQIWFRTDI